MAESLSASGRPAGSQAMVLAVSLQGAMGAVGNREVIVGERQRRFKRAITWNSSTDEGLRLQRVAIVDSQNP